MARVLVISLSDLGRDARVDRQIEFLAADHEVVAAGYGAPRHGASYIPLVQVPRGSLHWLARRIGMEMLRTLRADQLAYWIEAGHREWRAALAAVSPDLVVANDLSAAPLAFAAAAGAPVVLDLHEYAPLEHEENLQWRVLVAPQIDRLLQRYLPVAADVITVNDAIAMAYDQRYGRRPTVITNAARMSSHRPSEVLDARVRMVHHGSAIRGRHLESMIDLLDLLDDRFTLDMFLVGDERYIRELTTRANADPRINVHPPLSMDRIVGELNRFDIGLYILSPSNFNNLNALPNKFFDFVQARLAVAIGPSPAMADLVNSYGFGIVADSFEPATLASRLLELTAERLAHLKLATHLAAPDLSAERNGEIMRAVVARATASSSGRTERLTPQPSRP
jgi:hypothetical protein